MPNQVSAEVVRERYDRLAALQEDISWEANKALVGSSVEVIVSETEGRKDAATARLSGRAADNRLVHVANPEVSVRPGDAVMAVVTHAAPHHLVADTVLGVRPTRAGDAWQSRSTPATGVLLGMPSVMS
jgi:tRNA-2-methylthio-N6-dimethylallyladenosine synthase